VTFFGGKSNQLYKNSRGFSSYFLEFNNGARLEIMHLPQKESKAEANMYCGLDHIAFSVGTRERVIELTEKIVNAGYGLLSPPRETGDGYFESCVADPDGNRVEITE
jgi:lactoylglutathione lyase